MTRIFGGIGDFVKESTRNNFKNMSSPEGVPWKDLSVAAKLQRLRKSKWKHFKRGKPTASGNLSKYGRTALAGRFEILRDTSGLMDSVQIQKATAQSVTIGSRLKYAAIHQYGGQAGRGNKVTIPARPYIGINGQMRTDIVAIIQSHLGAASA